jgi:hypothetical protein
MIDIPFYLEFDSTRWAFLMTIEPDQIMGNYDENVARLNIGVLFKRVPPDNNQQQEGYPVILNLYGKLHRVNALHEYGATLQPIETLPINLIRANVAVHSYLSFVVSPRYLHFLEEKRVSQPGQDMMLAIQMWGTVAIMQLHSNISDVSTPLLSRSGELVRFEKVDTRNFSQAIRIAQSDWVNRILPSLGYRQSVLVELPLVRTPPMLDPYKNAAEALDKAQAAFKHEDYGGALKHAREVLEHLGKMSSDGSEKLTSFCKEYLEPFIGETRSTTIDRSLNALREVVNAASHTDPQKPFKADRAIADYVIETLALNLRYISTVLA